jgi:hypothetical protein
MYLNRCVFSLKPQIITSRLPVEMGVQYSLVVKPSKISGSIKAGTQSITSVTNDMATCFFKKIRLDLFWQMYIHTWYFNTWSET